MTEGQAEKIKSLASVEEINGWRWAAKLSGRKMSPEEVVALAEQERRVTGGK